MQHRSNFLKLKLVILFPPFAIFIIRSVKSFVQYINNILCYRLFLYIKDCRFYDSLLKLTDHFFFLVFLTIIVHLAFLPFLVLFGDVIGIFGGYVVGIYKLGFNPANYINATLENLQALDITTGVVKAAVFGFLIALMGCYNGYKSKGGAHF